MAAIGSNDDMKQGSAIARSTGRGPSYPALSLEEAVEKAQRFWAAAKRGAAPAVAVVKHWGYSETSSSGKTALAALLQYGLLEAEGALETRTVKLTARGLDIVLDEPSSGRRLAALRDAARAPKLYADIMARWPAHELPVDSMLRYYLIREKNFNEASVDGFIKDFRASLAYAQMDKAATMDALFEQLDADTEAVDAVTAEVQAPNPESRLSQAAPRAVREASTGVSAGTGEREWLRGPLSKQVSYRLVVSGDMGSREIGKLIKLLEAQKAVLEDDDDPFEK